MRCMMEKECVMWRIWRRGEAYLEEELRAFKASGWILDCLGLNQEGLNVVMNVLCSMSRLVSSYI